MDSLETKEEMEPGSDDQSKIICLLALRQDQSALSAFMALKGVDLNKTHIIWSIIECKKDKSYTLSWVNLIFSLFISSTKEVQSAVLMKLNKKWDDMNDYDLLCVFPLLGEKLDPSLMSLFNKRFLDRLIDSPDLCVNIKILVRQLVMEKCTYSGLLYNLQVGLQVITNTFRNHYTENFTSIPPPKNTELLSIMLFDVDNLIDKIIIESNQNSIRDNLSFVICSANQKTSRLMDTLLKSNAETFDLSSIGHDYISLIPNHTAKLLSANGSLIDCQHLCDFIIYSLRCGDPIELKNSRDLMALFLNDIINQDKECKAKIEDLFDEILDLSGPIWTVEFWALVAMNASSQTASNTLVSVWSRTIKPIIMRMISRKAGGHVKSASKLSVKDEGELIFIDLLRKAIDAIMADNDHAMNLINRLTEEIMTSNTDAFSSQNNNCFEDCL